MYLENIFKKYKINKGVLHVGAHAREEMPIYESAGMTEADVLWVDALKECVDEAKNMICAVVSDEDDVDVEFIVTNNRQSSSFLELKTHKVEHPDVVEVERRQLKTVTLNTLFERNKIRYDRYDVINLDIQGAELRALKGATKILPFVRHVYAEVNEKELYEGCGTIDQLDAFLLQWGFHRVETAMTCHGWGDAMYTKDYDTEPVPEPKSITKYGNDNQTRNILIITIVALMLMAGVLLVGLIITANYVTFDVK